MSSEIKPWISKVHQEDTSFYVKGEVENILSFNLHDFARFRTHKILIELSSNLHSNGNSAIIYGVGNFGFKLTNHFSPMTRDGKIEGHSNDPANDHDFIVVSNAEFNDFRQAATTAVETIRERYTNGKDEYFYPWTKLKKPRWNTSNFNIPSYCSVKYINRGHEKTTRNLMEIHHLKIKPNWQKELFSKYSPWYSNHLGFPIVPITEIKGDMNAGIWQPFYKEINFEKSHEIRISAPEVFGKDAQDVLQATRIVLATIQATFADNTLAVLSEKTKGILTKGIKISAAMLTDEQRFNAKSRLLTIIHRASSLQNEIKYEYGGPFGLPNPFTDSQPVDLVIKTLDEIGWGKAVLGKTVREFLN